MIKLILKTLHNPTNANVTDFPIAEPELINGEVRYDDNESIKSTGKTLLWSLASDETKAFPEYVAKELLKVYTFLKEVEGKEEEIIPEGEAKVGGKFVCRHCGKSFEGAKGLGLHFASKHPEKL